MFICIYIYIQIIHMLYLSLYIYIYGERYTSVCCAGRGAEGGRVRAGAVPASNRLLAHPANRLQAGHIAGQWPYIHIKWQANLQICKSADLQIESGPHLHSKRAISTNRKLADINGIYPLARKS